MATLVPWWVRRANCSNIFSDNVGTVPVQPVTALEPRQGEMSGALITRLLETAAIGRGTTGHRGREAGGTY